MYPLFLSVRFIWRHLLMTLIGSFFVGASLVVLIVVMAVMDGFQAKLKDTFAGSSADLIITPRFDADLDRMDATLRDLLGDRVVASGPHLETITLVRREGHVDPAISDEFVVAQIFGVDGRREQRVNHFGTYLHEPPKREISTVADLDAPFKVHDVAEAAYGRIGVILGTGLARRLRVGVGERVKLFSLVSNASGSNGGQDLDDYELRQDLFVVVGLYQSGNSEIDSQCVFLDSKDFGRFFDPATARRSLRAKLADPENDFDEAIAILRDNWWHVVEESMPDGRAPPPWLREDASRPSSAFRAEPWWYQHQQMVRAIESEKAMILVIAFLIVVAGASSIFAAQWLLVSDKVREIGILRALGAGVRGIATIFILNGFLMGVVGSAGGTLAGLLVVDYIDDIHEAIATVLGRKIFDPSIYLFESIPTKVDPEQVMQFALAALICTLIAAAIPALRAGLMDPAKALHHE